MAGILLYLQVGDSLGRGAPRGTSSLRDAWRGQREVPTVVGVRGAGVQGLRSGWVMQGASPRPGRPAGFLERQHCPPALLLVSCVCDFR